MRPRAVDVVHENPIINSTWRLRGPQDGPSIDAEHKLLARPSTHALLPHCKMAWARPLPDAWARPFTSIRTLYLMPMLLSKHPPCQSLGNVHCLLTTPKTGSSALKTGFQLPVALDARRRGADACRHVLVPYRDPISRFISGVGTVHGRCSYRGPREYMANANRCAGVRTNGSLTTMVDFEAYARLLLTSVRGHMARCTDAQMLAHLLPQAVFAAAVPPDATLYGMTVEAASRPAVQDLHASSASASACAPLVTHKVNAEEGVGTAPVIRGLNETMLPGGLLEAIVRTYAADYAWLGMPLPPSVAAIGGLDSPGPTSLPTATSSREVEQPTEETTTPRLVRPPVRAVREPAIAGEVKDGPRVEARAALATAARARAIAAARAKAVAAARAKAAAARARAKATGASASSGDGDECEPPTALDALMLSARLPAALYCGAFHAEDVRPGDLCGLVRHGGGDGGAGDGGRAALLETFAQLNVRDAAHAAALAGRVQAKCVERPSLQSAVDP